MKKMKRILFIIGIVFILGLVDLFIHNWAISTYIQSQFLRSFENVENMDVVDTQSIYGKLNGNGNGINFMGVVLVRCNDETTIIGIVDQLSNKYELVDYCKQNNQIFQTKENEHCPIQFEVAISGQDYYVVYYYESHIPYSVPVDIVGH